MLNLKRALSTVIAAYNSGDPSLIATDGIPEIRNAIPGTAAPLPLNKIKRSRASLMRWLELDELKEVPLARIFCLSPPNILIERGRGVVFEARSQEELLAAILILSAMTTMPGRKGLVLLDMVSRCENCRAIFISKTARRARYCGKKCRNRAGYALNRKRKLAEGTAGG